MRNWCLSRFATKLFIWSKPKLRTYCLIKDQYQAEAYVNYNLNKRQRSLCAQLRTGTLPLALETGRFSNTPEEGRICLLCKLSEVENEVHFLFYCDLYDDLRVIFMQKILDINPNFFDLQDYEKMKFCFERVIFPLVEFLEKAWERRQGNLFPM